MTFISFPFGVAVAAICWICTVLVAYEVGAHQDPDYRAVVNYKQVLVFVMGFTLGFALSMGIEIAVQAGSDVNNLGLGLIPYLAIGCFACILAAFMMRLSKDIVSGVDEDNDALYIAGAQLLLMGLIVSIGFVAPGVLYHYV